MLLDREDKKSQLEALRKSLDYLKDGSSVFVFPEGTRSRDGRLGEFKLGTFTGRLGMDGLIDACGRGKDGWMDEWLNGWMGGVYLCVSI